MEEGAPSTAQLVLQGKCVAKFNGLRPNAADPVTGGDVTAANFHQQLVNWHQQLGNLQRQRAKLHRQFPLGDWPLRRQPANLHHQSAEFSLPHPTAEREVPTNPSPDPSPLSIPSFSFYILTLL